MVGGCGGIGRALVAACLSLDHRVTVLDLPGSLLAHPPPAGVAARPLDVTDPAGIAAAFDGIPALDALVNLAGYADARVAVDALDPARWQGVIDANLTGAFLVARAALPRLRAGTAPALVHVASGLAARLQPGYAAYGASKAGLIALTKSIAAENAPALRANVVAPGAVDTAFLHGGTGRDRTAARLDTEGYARTLPMGRIATAADVVGPILFLCGPGAAYMTGQVLWVNGGGLTP